MATESVQDRAKRLLLQQRLGRDIRLLRESAGLSQQSIADLFGWGRDAISKLESGSIATTVYNYLALMQFLASDVEPDHPAVILARRLMPSSKAVRQPRGV